LWNLSDLLIAKYSNGFINDIKNNKTICGGYPNWWLNETGYQYGPRIYQYAQLQKIPSLKYTNETEYTEHREELNHFGGR
jgi:dipeptidase